MKTVRLGIAGLGNMGATHARQILDGKIPRLRLVAVADNEPGKVGAFPGIRGFGSAAELVGSGLIDALLVATPHYDHTLTGIAALEAGLHVLVEKPISVHRTDCERLIAAYAGREDRQVFAAMFNQRTDPSYRKIRQLVRTGALGEVRRVNWIVTDWFRTAAYYASGSWRATWAGEGGGVLLNQCPHNLDLLQWIVGMPARVFARCVFGKYHDIEVEDEVSALLEYPNGATGVFVASTGEATGCSRLEIVGECGTLVFENGTIRLHRNEVPMSEFSRMSSEPFGRPVSSLAEMSEESRGGQHNEILANFADAILDGAPLIAPAAEGIHSVELANAMLLSTWLGRSVSLPIDGEEYVRELGKRIGGSAGGMALQP
jgi:predicted dehydrogenase